MGKTQQPPTPSRQPARETPAEKLARMIREQGVKPFDGFRESDAEWPAEYNFDGFDDWHRQYKAAQRTIPPKPNTF